MRLINIYSLELRSFRKADLPTYVTLSHRWTEDEISYEEYTEATKHQKAGYQKVKQFCEFMRLKIEQDRDDSGQHSSEPQWVWIDTCCIDKRSSSELSEAINSMAQWYADSSYCVTYLSDLDDHGNMSDCVWFTRGWTLQELVVPEEIIFCDQNWKVVGKKTEPNMSERIAAITGIPQQCLLDVLVMLQQSVACKMSWAAKRTCEREEDIAYCLLGLFGIQMPLLYGEGERAFQRLQEEIARQSDDESIFAWNIPVKRKEYYFKAEVMSFFGTLHILDRHSFVGFGSVFAPDPTFFERCGNIARQTISPRRPYTLSNKGLEFEGPFLKLSSGWIQPTYILELNCVDKKAIDLRKESNVSEYQSEYDTRSCLVAFEQTAEDKNLLRRVAPVSSDYALWWILGNHEKMGYTMEIVQRKRVTIEVDHAWISGLATKPAEESESRSMTVAKFMESDQYTAGLPIYRKVGFSRKEIDDYMSSAMEHVKTSKTESGVEQPSNVATDRDFS